MWEMVGSNEEQSAMQILINKLNSDGLHQSCSCLGLYNLCFYSSLASPRGDVEQMLG